MKFFINAAIAISLFAPAASAAQTGSAFSSLLTSAGLSSSAGQADLPAVPAAAAVPSDVQAPVLGSDLTDLNSRQADALVNAARADGFGVFELDGAKMTTKPALLAYSAQALGLPADMDNWDAMIDYLGDMPTFHHNNKILIIVRNSSAIQNADAKLYADLRNVTELSCENAGEWSRSTATLKFAFVQ